MPQFVVIFSMIDSALVLPDERRQHLQLLLSREGKLVITELSRRLGVSGDTLRRDIQELAEAGLVQRVRGGALPLSPSTAPYPARRETRLTAKREVAVRAVRLIRPGQVLLLDGGTTVLEVARHLPTDLRLTVVTPSPPVVMALAEHPGVEIILLGGTLNQRTMTVTGSSAYRALTGLNVDLCLLGVCSLHPELGLTGLDYEEAQLKRLMVRQAGETVVLLTADKLGTASPYKVAELSELTHLVTEASVPDEVLAPYRQAGVGVVGA